MKDIPKEYDTLLSEFLTLQKELDSTNQQFYDCKRQLKIVEALQKEYQQEIEIVNNEEQQLKEKYDLKISQLEEEIVNLKTSHNNKYTSLESDLIREQEEKERLQAQIEELKSCNVSIIKPNNDIDKLLDELLAAKEENCCLSETISENNLKLELQHKQNVELNENITHLKCELESIKEMLNCKKEELSEKNDLIQNIQDELYCTKTELESLRSKPLDQKSTGNSLFAEVDDRRLHLQKNYNLMKTQYIEMKRERANHLKQISTLRNENQILCARWKSEVEEKAEDEDMIINSYKERIKVLESIIDGYKKDLAEKPAFVSDIDVEFFNRLINNKMQKIESLREEMRTRSLSQTLMSYNLAEAHQEIRKWRLEATASQSEVENLKQQLNELKKGKVEEKILVDPSENKKTDEPSRQNYISEGIKDKCVVNTVSELTSCLKKDETMSKATTDISSLLQSCKVEPEVKVEYLQYCEDNIAENSIHIKTEVDIKSKPTIKNEIYADSDSVVEIVEKQDIILVDLIEENQEVLPVANKIVNFNEDIVKSEFSTDSKSNNFNTTDDQDKENICMIEATENNASKKKVTFTEDSVQNSSSTKSTVRKGRVVMQLKPTFIPKRNE